MSEVLEFAARLSTVVGPRPAGTEEEQQASFFIEEAMSEAGLDTSVEEFSCNPNYEVPRIVCCIVSIVLAVLAIILPLMVIPAFFVCAAAAVFFVLEVLGTSPLNNASKGGVSQNVIAKYYPGMSLKQDAGGMDASDENASLEKIDGKSSSDRHRHHRSGSESHGHRKRKIIILARYDSGKVRAELKPPFIGILDKIHIVEVAGMILVPIALLLRMATGAIDEGHIVWDIFIGIGAFCSLLPVIAYILHQTAAYNEGANNNASGVAVMTEVAKRLVQSSKPSLSSKVLPDPDGLSFALPTEPEDPTVIAAIPELSTPSPLPILHGKDAIEAAGVLPVNTDLIYDEAANGMLEKEMAERNKFLEEQDTADKTAAFVPVAPEETQEKQSGSHPLRNDGKSALSLETQMQSASKEFAKFDEHSEEEVVVEENLNPWDRLKNESREIANANNREEAGAGKSNAPDVTADLLGAQTISIQDQQKPADDPNVPDWFKKGMAAASANKSEEGEEDRSVKRSRFADALDAAHETSAQALENFGAKDSQGDKTASGIDKSRLDELHARILGESGASVTGGMDVSSEAKAARKAKLIAARDANNASKGDGTGELAAEMLQAEELSDEASTLATIEAKMAEQVAAQAQAAEEVAEQAAVADRTISFIPVAADIPTDVNAQSASTTGSHDPIKKTAEERLDDAASLTGSRRAVSADEDIAKVGRRSISLPNLTVSRDKKEAKQDAPLAVDAEREKGEARTALKNVGGEIEYGTTASKVSKQTEAKEGVSQSLEGATTNFLKKNAEVDAQAALSSLESPSTTDKASQSTKRAANSVSAKIAAIPSVSASSDKPEVVEEGQITVSTAGSFVQSSQTSNFKPVGDELIANMNSEDIIVEDVDDSDYTENITHTGAIAGPGYVEMPKSRMHRIKSFFGKKKSKEEESISFTDAVGLEENFDAREVGKARGSWESFKNDSGNLESAGAPQSNSHPLNQPQAGQVPYPAQGAPQNPGQFQGNPQMPRQGQSISHDLQAGPSQNPQRGPMPMPMQGQPMPGPGQMPMQGQPMPGQMRPQGQMPMQGAPYPQRPPQGQYPPQYQAQMHMQMQMQMQAQQMGRPMPGPGQMPMQGQPMPGQMMPQGQAPQQAQLAQGNSESHQKQMQEQAEKPENDSVDITEEAPKKPHSFSFFKKKNKDGDMNSGAFDDADWNGGAFSIGRDKDSGESRRSRRSSSGSSRGSRGQSAPGGRRRSADEVLAEEAMAEMTEDELAAQDMLDERDQIRNFRSSSTQLTSFEEVAAFASTFSQQSDDGMQGEFVDGVFVEEEPDIGFQTEVWFVALGAELANNAGIKNLLAEHGDELRGAVVIDIDAFGAGHLSVIEEEGVLKRVKSSTRMRRYATKAASALGLKLGSGKMLWRESAAYFTTKRGLLTMHLCGMAGDKPAYAGEIDDTFDKLDEETMLQNAAFLLELINAI